MIGRERELAALSTALAETSDGRGGVFLLAGEAGVGKTRLAREAVDRAGLLALQVVASSMRVSPYGPLVAALRAYRRAVPDAEPCDPPLLPYLAVLVPELGSPQASADAGTLVEALHSAFTIMARQRPTVVVLDDLQCADHATLELLSSLAPRLVDIPLLVLGAYRNDELTRDHPLRRLRVDLRRAGLLREVVLGPLRPDETDRLAAGLLGRPPSPALATLLHERADGLPFFVEELVAALQRSGRLRDADGGVALSEGDGVPIPDTVRDLVVLRTMELGDAEREALDVAAVAGVSFDLDLVAEVAGGEEHLAGLLDAGLLMESEPGVGAFRHALVREACYGEIPWPRRRALHRQVAELLDRRGAAPAVLAEHWLAARQTGRAREALLAAMDAACRVHAYRDAARVGEQALALWPEGQWEPARLDVLDRLGSCAQLCGDLTRAARAWREVAGACAATGPSPRLAEVHRRLAGVYELQGQWERALAARAAAATAFAASGQPGAAAAERLAAAAHLRSALRFEPALELLAVAEGEARRANRYDLQARIRGLEGNVRARRGEHQVGVERVREALALALAHDLSGPAAEIYQRLADALEHSGTYAAARESYETAAAFCEEQGAEAVEQLCLACMTVVLRQTGEWDRCLDVCRSVLGSGAATAHARTVALGTQGIVLVLRGETARGRGLLVRSELLARQIELVAMELLSLWGLAVADEQGGAAERAEERCFRVLDRWGQTEERHYVVPVLRWAATLLGTRRAGAGVRACANALAHVVAEAGTGEAVAALSHALGEVSLLDGWPAQAAHHFGQAFDRLEGLGLPYEQAHTLLRGGVALEAAGDRQKAAEHLSAAYRRARNLGARPLAAVAARHLASLGEPVEGRLGRRAGTLLGRVGLTRRELEVLRLVADGRTDREIARVLVLSPRTVEMHVANGLAKLSCRSRAEAVRRAAELGVFRVTADVAKVP